MKNQDDSFSSGRRTFIKAGLTGVAAASLVASPAGRFVWGQAPATTPSYRKLGRTGLKVTTVSYGTMLTPEYEVIRAGIDMGINYLDTARRYLNGRSEEIVSRAVEGIREKVYISTKSTGDTRKALLGDVDTSLERLRTDYVDILYLHNLTDAKRASDPEIRSTLTDLRKQGKVRFFGVSTHTNQAEVVNGVVDDPDKFFDVVLVGYNFQSDPSVKQAIARAHAAGLGVVAMKTQAGGYETSGMGRISPHQAALKWVLQDTNVSTAIPGMKSLAHLRELVPVMGMKLTRADERILDRYAEAITPYYCRLCGECQKSCPRGVEISTVNRALMYAEGYKEVSLGQATFREASLASRCADCAECVAHCAHGLDIAEKMRRARSLFA
jgi:predicted aldo/keto reductase-like oxidoreductase